MASVLPPAPAQKSTTISPRLASSSRASNCEPSSCTSMAPRVNTSSFGQRRFAFDAQAPGRILRGFRFDSCLRKLLLHIRPLFCQNVDPHVQTGASSSAATSGQKPSPSWAFRGVTSQSGRLWRWRSIRSPTWMLSQRASQFFLVGQGAIARNSRPWACESPEWPDGALSGHCPRAQCGRTAAFCATRHRPSRPGWRARAGQKCGFRERNGTPRVGGVVKLEGEPDELGAGVEQGFRMHKPLLSHSPALQPCLTPTCPH
jgi:hypothetical protein